MGYTGFKYSKRRKIKHYKFNRMSVGTTKSENNIFKEQNNPILQKIIL